MSCSSKDITFVENRIKQGWDMIKFQYLYDTNQSSKIDINTMRKIVAARTIIVDNIFNCVKQIQEGNGHNSYTAFGSANLTSDYDITILSKDAPDIMLEMFKRFYLEYKNTFPQAFDTNLYCIGYFLNEDIKNNKNVEVIENKNIVILRPRDDTDFKNLLFFTLLKFQKFGLLEELQEIMKLTIIQSLFNKNELESELDEFNKCLTKLFTIYYNQSGGSPPRLPPIQQYNQKSLSVLGRPALPNITNRKKPGALPPLSPTKLNLSKIKDLNTNSRSSNTLSNREFLSLIKNATPEQKEIIAQYSLYHFFSKRVYESLYKDYLNPVVNRSINCRNKINQNLLSLVSTALYFAMEAYFTTATINVVVMEMQSNLISECYPIEYYCSVLENLADYIIHLKQKSNEEFVANHNKILLTLSKYVYRIYYSLYKLIKSDELRNIANRINSEIVSQRGVEYTLSNDNLLLLSYTNGKNLDNYVRDFSNQILSILNQSQMS